MIYTNIICFTYICKMFLKPIKDINFLNRGDFLDGLSVEKTTDFNVFLSDGTRRSWRRVIK